MVLLTGLANSTSGAIDEPIAIVAVKRDLVNEPHTFRVVRAQGHDSHAPRTERAGETLATNGAPMPVGRHLGPNPKKSPSRN